MPGPFRPLPEGAGGEYRVGRELGVHPHQEIEEGVLPNAGVVPIGPDRETSPTHMDRAVLRGQSGSAERERRHGADPVWFGLAARRRSGRTTQLRVGPPTTWIH